MKNYFRNIYLGVATVLASMRVTARHLFIPSITLQYPFEKRDLPGWQGTSDKVFTRHKLHVDIDDCIGCLQCERACPVECIEIETIKTLPGEDLGKASTGNPKRLWVAKFDIDMEKCCYCGLCVYPCPTYCIHLTDDYEYSVIDKTEHLYHFGLMTEEEAARKRLEVAEAMKKEKEEKAKKKAQAEAEGSKTDETGARGEGSETKESPDREDGEETGD
jgi:NADH-quinone oxidoreductase subunit I